MTNTALLTLYQNSLTGALTNLSVLRTSVAAHIEAVNEITSRLSAAHEVERDEVAEYILSIERVIGKTLMAATSITDISNIAQLTKNYMQLLTSDSLEELNNECDRLSSLAEELDDVVAQLYTDILEVSDLMSQNDGRLIADELAHSVNELRFNLTQYYVILMSLKGSASACMNL